PRSARGRGLRSATPAPAWRRWLASGRRHAVLDSASADAIGKRSSGGQERASCRLEAFAAPGFRARGGLPGQAASAPARTPVSSGEPRSAEQREWAAEKG